MDKDTYHYIHSMIRRHKRTSRLYGQSSGSLEPRETNKNSLIRITAFNGELNILRGDYAYLYKDYYQALQQEPIY